METRELDIFLKEGLATLGFKINSDRSKQFLAYLNALQDYAKKVNITNIRDSREIITEHFVDSLSCLLGISLFEGIKVVDIGAGAGFPGVPLKIYAPEIDLALLESSLKHLEFLYRLRGVLEIDFEILPGRAEDYGQKKEYREKFDLAVARGVARLNILTEYALPLLSTNGVLVAQKGVEIEKEIWEATEVLRLLGGKIRTIKEVILPFSDKKRNLVIIDKIGNTPLQYPRRPGVPFKRPLRSEKNG